MNLLRPLLLFILFIPQNTFSQPLQVEKGTRFTLDDDGYSEVFLVGDFNGWSPDRMALDSGGRWMLTKSLTPGLYQYKFLAEGESYLVDPGNPAAVVNYDGSGRNSVFAVLHDGSVELTADTPTTANPEDIYPDPDGKKPLLLNIIWHQHQPLYVDPATDQLKGPWVRTHGTKDYYDMAAILREYPNIHCTFNLTSSLLLQIQKYYVERLAGFVDTETNRVDVQGFLQAWKGRTDPWIDLALKPTSQFDNEDKAQIFMNPWNAFGISEVLIDRFPQYRALREKLEVEGERGFNLLNEQEIREAKFWFYAGNFDPDFLRGTVSLPDGSICDLSDLFLENEDGEFVLRRPVTEDDCRRMVAETFKVMKNIVPIHRELLYDHVLHKGQIDIITTPYYHPILPLLYDSELARIAQPNDTLPERFSYPADAGAHIKKSVRFYRELFGVPPRGMWPAEGAVADPVLKIFHENGIEWIASDMKVLGRSLPEGRIADRAYRFSADENGEAGVVLVFRDTELSDRIGFTYQTYDPEVAAEDFVQSLLAHRKSLDTDNMLTVILDGENAWEWYRKDHDAKRFLHAFYRKLTKLYELGMITTTTMSEYLEGNDERGIAPHPVEHLDQMDLLHPGSWINANYDTWIGEVEENEAWSYLLTARRDLAESGVAQPDPEMAVPHEGSKQWFEYMAWEAMYAAEGSDWFWWYGSDQNAPGGDKPFDTAFRVHLNNVYEFLAGAGASPPQRVFEPIILSDQAASTGQGAMAQGGSVTQQVLFTCDAWEEHVDSAIFITGNVRELGVWTPNIIRMFDDGTHGDLVAGDDIWSLSVDLPVGREIQYKYTNSGVKGQWIPGEEFPSRNRQIYLIDQSSSPVVVHDVFGKLMEE